MGQSRRCEGSGHGSPLCSRAPARTAPVPHFTLLPLCCSHHSCPALRAAPAPPPLCCSPRSRAQTGPAPIPHSALLPPRSCPAPLPGSIPHRLRRTRRQGGHSGSRTAPSASFVSGAPGGRAEPRNWHSAAAPGSAGAAPRCAAAAARALPRSSAARSPHRPCASCVLTEQLPAPGRGLDSFNVSAAAALHPVSDYPRLTPPCLRPRGASYERPARELAAPVRGTLTAPPRPAGEGAWAGAAVPGLFGTPQTWGGKGGRSGTPGKAPPREAGRGTPRPGSSRPCAGRRRPRGKEAAPPGKEVSAGPGRLRARPLRLGGCW